MPPAVFQIGRAVLIALVGVLATMIVNRFDKNNQDKNHDPGWDDSDHW